MATTVASAASKPIGTPAGRLREALLSARAERRCLLVPACFDALGAKLIASHGGFEAAFMSGYGVSASRLGQPDAGIISYAEMEDAGRLCCTAAPFLPIIGDGDTGFGEVQNIWRAVHGYAAAGFAAISIEDQTFPKRCSFSRGMRCVDREEAVKRVEIALAAAKSCYETTGREILVVGRTDVRNDESLGDKAFQEVLCRAKAFEELGCGIVYFEGPQNEEEMRKFNQAISRASTMLAQVEKPGRALLSTEQCAELGYSMCLHGLTLLSASVRAMEQALGHLASGSPPKPVEEGGILCSFDHLYSVVGFEELAKQEERFL